MNCGIGGRWTRVLHEMTPIKKPASADAGFLIPGRLGELRLVADPHRPRTIIRAQRVAVGVIDVGQGRCHGLTVSRFRRWRNCCDGNQASGAERRAVARAHCEDNDRPALGSTGMTPRIGRMPPLALLLALLLQACSSNPPRTDPAYLQQLEQQASAGSFDSAWNAAERLEARNDPRAIHWYERAAATTPWTFRNTRAALRASPPKAERWYLAAAMHADPYAIAELAKFHRDRGNAAAALRWDLRATVYHRYWSGSSGLPDAVAPRNGEVHPLVRDIQRRAHSGDAEAQVDLGALYEKGLGVASDGAEALRWYQRAADQGNVYGQYFTGLLLGRGSSGVTRDVDAAAVWFAKASAQTFYMADEAYWREAIKPPFWTFD